MEEETAELSQGKRVCQEEKEGPHAQYSEIAYETPEWRLGGGWGEGSFSEMAGEVADQSQCDKESTNVASSSKLG